MKSFSSPLSPQPVFVVMGDFFFSESIPSWALYSFYWRVYFVNHLVEKSLFNIFKPSLGRISCALRTHHWSQKKELQSYSYIQCPTHCVLLWGPHYRNHSMAIHWYVFNYLYFFTFCLSCSFYFCDITSLYEKPGRKGEAEPTCQKPWEAFFILRQEFATFFSIQFLMMKRITPPPSQASELCLFGLCICPPPSTASSNSFRDINKQIKWCVVFRNS